MIVWKTLRRFPLALHCGILYYKALDTRKPSVVEQQTTSKQTF